MLFANARIGMNDVYVTTFLVLAALLFAPLYLRPRRPWTAAALLVGVGLALGLALASKWVALYAIGGLVLLVLFRSGLGRIIALLGMIGLTAVLGAMAIRPRPSTTRRAIGSSWFSCCCSPGLLAAAMVRRPLPVTGRSCAWRSWGLRDGATLVVVALARPPGSWRPAALASGWAPCRRLAGGRVWARAWAPGHGSGRRPTLEASGTRRRADAETSAWLQPGRLAACPGSSPWPA